MLVQTQLKTGQAIGIHSMFKSGSRLPAASQNGLQVVVQRFGHPILTM